MEDLSSHSSPNINLFIENFGFKSGPPAPPSQLTFSLRTLDLSVVPPTQIRTSHGELKTLDLSPDSSHPPPKLKLPMNFDFRFESFPSSKIHGESFVGSVETTLNTGRLPSSPITE